MSDYLDTELTQFIVNYDRSQLKKQYRGVMICNQPQRWQYSIEQVGIIKDVPILRSPREKEENPLLVKQEQKLLKELKKVHNRYNKKRITSVSPVNENRQSINQSSGRENCLSTLSIRTDNNREKYPLINKQLSVSLQKKASSKTYFDDQNPSTKRTNSTNAQRIIVDGDQSLSLKERFDDYNKAVAQMNKQFQGEKKVCLPKIYDEQKSIQIARLSSESAVNNRSMKLKNQYYSPNIFKSNNKSVLQAMNQQQQIMNRMISSKLDPQEQEELFNQQNQVEMEVIEPVNFTVFHTKNTSPLKNRKKSNNKRIKSAKVVLSEQQKVKLDVQNIIKQKSNLTNQYYDFMSSLKMIS